MRTHSFELYVAGVPTDEAGFGAFAEALFPHAPDCTPSPSVIGFDRDAPDLREAIASAIDSVHRADPSVTVIGIVMEDGQPIDGVLEAATTSGGP